MGDFLVDAGPPVHADIAVVLAGDMWGHRILKAAQLVQEGFVPKVLVSGPSGNYGQYESDLAVAFAVRHGYPRDWFIPFPLEAASTDEEARIIVPELRRRGVRSLLLVTSDYHTRRAGRIYRRQAPDLKIRVVSAPDEYFRADGWWRTRQGRKQAFFEWSKTVAGWMGL
jgi:uncharacterized SAM-binding protein YcdF (DUF218 family)